MGHSKWSTVKHMSSEDYMDIFLEIDTDAS